MTTDVRDEALNKITRITEKILPSIDVPELKSAIELINAISRYKNCIVSSSDKEKFDL